MNNRGTTDDSVLYEMARSDFAEGSRQMTENMATATQLRAEVKTYEGQRDELNKKIDSVNEKIASIEEDYLNRKSVVEAEYDAKLESAAAGAKAPTLAALVDKLDIDGFGLSSVISDADRFGFRCQRLCGQADRQGASGYVQPWRRTVRNQK